MIIKTENLTKDYETGTQVVSALKGINLSVEKNNVSIPPLSSVEINSTIKTTADQQTGIYDGFLLFDGKFHKLNVLVDQSLHKF